jgi:polyribonucleotide nucleotidyltransferase
MTKQKQCTYVGSFKDKPLILETGFLARLATSSVLATYGETKVLASVVVGNKTSLDYLPLQVIYEERLYATGKIKGSRFIKREGKPTDNAVLTGRLIDRSLRSLFNPNIRNDIQVIVTVLSVDEVNSPDTLSVLAASAALSLCSFETDSDEKLDSKDLFAGPVSAIRIGLKTHSFGENIIPQIESIVRSASSYDEIVKPLQEVSSILDTAHVEDQNHIRNVFNILNSKNPQWASKFRELEKDTPKLSQSQITEKYNLVPDFLIQPSYDDMKLSQLDLVVSGSDSTVTMIEAGAQIISESILTNALEISQNQLATLTGIQEAFVAQYHASNDQKIVQLSLLEPSKEYYEYWLNLKDEFEQAVYSTHSKTERNDLLNTLFETHVEKMSEDEEFKKSLFRKAYEEVYKQIVQSNIIEKKRRLDGRNLDEIREITCIPAILPRTHGSSIFQRGETQVLNILTLGTNRDAQILDGMEDFEEQTKRYIHHYNFPAYSVGETGRYYGPGRREIGHGALAEKALLPVLPSQEQFPYTMRLVSECLGSNGSTSMASTCASCLSLLDGGVPIKDLVAGIAMGVVINEETGEYEILTDIQGAEDHYGDMDFKVAGTETGITALQLDNKVQGLQMEVLFDAIKAALEGRLFILGKMKDAISQPRPSISQYAPRVITIDIPAEKIGEVIGPSGKVIKSIIQKYEVEIDIEDVTGKTFIYGKDNEKVEAAQQYITKLIKGYNKGDIVEGKVFRIENYGAFVKIDGTDKEGLIHISEIANRRITKVEDVITMDDVVKAKIIDINDKGKISLSIRKLESNE